MEGRSSLAGQAAARCHSGTAGEVAPCLPSRQRTRSGHACRHGRNALHTSLLTDVILVFQVRGIHWVALVEGDGVGNAGVHTDDDSLPCGVVNGPQVPHGPTRFLVWEPEPLISRMGGHGGSEPSLQGAVDAGQIPHVHLAHRQSKWPASPGGSAQRLDCARLGRGNWDVQSASEV